MRLISPTFCCRAAAERQAVRIRLLKASPGKKVVQDVRDTTNQVEIDGWRTIPGTISTAVNPEGRGG